MLDNIVTLRNILQSCLSFLGKTALGEDNNCIIPLELEPHVKQLGTREDHSSVLPASIGAVLAGGHRVSNLSCRIKK